MRFAIGFSIRFYVVYQAVRTCKAPIMHFCNDVLLVLQIREGACQVADERVLVDTMVATQVKSLQRAEQRKDHLWHIACAIRFSIRFSIGFCARYVCLGRPANAPPR